MIVSVVHWYDGEKLQVDFGHEETALVKTSQIVDYSEAAAY